jgi:DNA-binding Lrp family transcriptional regulator
MAVVMTRSPQELAKFIENEISVIPGVARTESFVNLDIIKGGWLGIDTSQLISAMEVNVNKKQTK